MSLAEALEIFVRHETGARVVPDQFRRAASVSHGNDDKQFNQCEGALLHGFSARPASTAVAKHEGHRQSAPGAVDGGSGAKPSHQQPPILHSNAWPHLGQTLTRIGRGWTSGKCTCWNALAGPFHSHSSG